MFNSSLQSTLGCPGGPNDENYFTYDEEDKDAGMESGSKNHPLRRKTLFNIYSFTEDIATRNATPELTLQGCTFEHFFNNYESLIHIETDNIW